MWPIYSRFDKDMIKCLHVWSRTLWGKPYSDDFMCADPWIKWARDLHGVRLAPTAGADSPRLADWWFRKSKTKPTTGEEVGFRFQIEDDAISTLRPNGVTHIEMLIALDPASDSGLCLGVGLPHGPTPLNGTFGVHPFAPGMPGDGWFDPSDTRRTTIRYLDWRMLT